MNNSCWLIDQEQYDAAQIAQKIYDYIDISGVRKVFIKPNMVINPWKGEEENWVATVTNVSIIEAVLIVLRDKSRHSSIEVTVGDAPMARTNIKEVLRLNKLLEIIAKYQSPTMIVNFIDIREWYWKYVAEMCVSRHHLSGDPLGNVLVNMGDYSAFSGKKSLNYEAFDNIVPVNRFHNEKDNIYSISKSVLESELFINLPKMKTHRIAGITCAMKNLVGINSNKNCVPHNTTGSVNENGDESPNDSKKALNESAGIGGIARKIFRLKIPAINYLFVPAKILYDKTKGKQNSEKIGYGMWYGNDTIWRSILDLNRVLFFADSEGVLHDEQQRKYLCITDAIVSGEGEGPLHPTPVNTNVLLVSDNPLIIDTVAAEIMGVDYRKVPSIYQSYNHYSRYNFAEFRRDEISVYIENERVAVDDIRNHYAFSFVPTAGWTGHIEKE